MNTENKKIVMPQGFPEAEDFFKSKNQTLPIAYKDINVYAEFAVMMARKEIEDRQFCHLTKRAEKAEAELAKITSLIRAIYAKENELPWPNIKNKMGKDMKISLKKYLLPLLLGLLTGTLIGLIIRL